VTEDAGQQGQLLKAFQELDNLSKDEYGASLSEVLADPTRVQEDRLWRVGRLIGITVKEPFAEPAAIKPGTSATSARRAWNLDLAKLDSESTGLWQYRLISGLLADRDLRRVTWLGPDPAWVADSIISYLTGNGQLPDDLPQRLQSSLEISMDAAEAAASHIYQRAKTITPTSAQMTDWLWSDLGAELQSPLHVGYAMQEMQHERGFWKSMAVSASKFICGDKKLQSAIEKSASSGGLASGALSPQSMIGAGSVAAADALGNTVPWLSPSGTIVTVGFLVIIGNVGANGFCDWVAQYVQPKTENPEIES
jgi:hypothetical protein